MVGGGVVTRDRDVLVPKHETPRGGVPSFVSEEATGRYEGEDLAIRRARRPTPERIGRLELRVDKLDKDMAVGFAESKTALTTLLSLAAKADAERERRAIVEAQALESRRKYVIGLIGALATAAALVIAALVGRS